MDTLQSPGTTLPKAWGAALIVLAASAVLALLHLGRSILVPMTMAVVLCFAISPLVRKLRDVGLGHVSSVLAAVLSSVVVISLLGGLIGFHALRIPGNLPAYQARLDKNLHALRRFAFSAMDRTWGAAEQMLDAPDGSAQLVPAGQAIPVEVRPPKPAPMERVQRLLSWAWGPIGSAGIIVLVLIFLLLERESLRDRFIRLVGGADLSATTSAINDAGERLSRYLARQFAVNIGFGLAIWVALTCVGLPEAALFAALSAVMRFVPYVGVPVVALLAMALALGVSEGWTLMLLTAAVFLVIDLLAAHVIEPRVYGQATGLSRLSIVLATLFWGWLWGPAGVIIATPLTLCLAVAGRHAESLGFLDIVLGDGPALTMAQKFYQRALSGDSGEIIAGAREFLKRRSFAAYCDAVLMPSLRFGVVDFANGRTTLRQQTELRTAIVQVVETLAGAERPSASPTERTTVLVETSSGRMLRERRMFRQRTESNAPQDAAPIVLCVGLGAPGDDLATELLVRILRQLSLDARHLSFEDMQSMPDLRTAVPAVRAICLVTLVPAAAPGSIVPLARRMRAEAPGADLSALLLGGMAEGFEQPELGEVLDRTICSYEQVAAEMHARLAGGPAQTRAVHDTIDRSFEPGPFAG
ncbi:AI-2E family transporter [Rhizobacter sp. Root1221]|uniref:AI-2E family transporter n=1 Tax=Rhizobacter sp. Root1221 TaxID=1736433 RepID=UPI0006F60FCB|nr:AI-2E family transporter [Rhizobacter sp. Root1221]KQV83027.1 hypothetical protein ASC87_08780 [Rhizobacter sp. Root1221]